MLINFFRNGLFGRNGIARDDYEIEAGSSATIPVATDWTLTYNEEGITPGDPIDDQFINIHVGPVAGAVAGFGGAIASIPTELATATGLILQPGDPLVHGEDDSIVLSASIPVLASSLTDDAATFRCLVWAEGTGPVELVLNCAVTFSGQVKTTALISEKVRLKPGWNEISRPVVFDCLTAQDPNIGLFESAQLTLTITLDRYPDIEIDALGSMVWSGFSLLSEANSEALPPGVTVLHGTGAPADSLGTDGDYYLDTEDGVGDGDIYFKASGEWARIVSGGTTMAGTTWLNGGGVPDNDDGDNGNYYLNTETGAGEGDVYVKSADVWVKVSSGVGSITPNTGTVWLYGAGNPTSAIGADGNLYLTTGAGPAAEIGDVWLRSGSTWTIIVHGGATPTGTTWLNGEGAPDNEDGDNGNYYLDTEVGVGEGDVYIKVAGTWLKIAGGGTEAAAVWLNGEGTPANSLGSDGDYYLDTEVGVGEGNIWTKITGVWVFLASGVAGATATWLSGAGAPAGGLGAAGNYYLDTVTGNVWQKGGGGWVKVYDHPVVGVPGTTWHRGTGVPAATLGANGDYFINAAGDVYAKAGGAWVLNSSGTGRPYDVYVALVSQADVNAPSATVLENTIGTITWARTSEGIYTATCAGAFTADKTTATIALNYFGVDVLGVIQRTSADVLTVQTQDGVGWSDDYMTPNTVVEIRVYP